MPETLRLSHSSLRVLRAFLEAHATSVRSELAGADIMQASGLPSGTVYPILLRFEKAGLLVSRWEDGQPEELGRPRRRFYQITPSGVELAHETLRALSSPLEHRLPGEA
jgi:PadR family transcriptional regulator, regulatory protein PadR